MTSKRGVGQKHFGAHNGLDRTVSTIHYIATFAHRHGSSKVLLLIAILDNAVLGPGKVNRTFFPSDEQFIPFLMIGVVNLIRIDRRTVVIVRGDDLDVKTLDFIQLDGGELSLAVSRVEFFRGLGEKLLGGPRS